MKKRLLPVISIVALLALCGAVFCYMQTASRFDIAKVRITGHIRLTPDDIVAQLQIPPRTNIFHIRLDDLQRKLEMLTWVKTARVYRNFPDKLTVSLVERTPFALVKLDELYLVDEDGVPLGLLASGSAIHLPILTGPFVTTHMKPDGANPELQHALHALTDLQTSQHPLLQQIRKMYIECPENVTVFASEVSPVIRLSLRDYQQSLHRLMKISPELQVETLATIDLRFEKRVIITPKNS